MWWCCRKHRREHEAGPQHQPPRWCRLDHVGLFDYIAPGVDPANVPTPREVARWREPVVPVAPARCDELVPHRIWRRVDVDGVEVLAHRFRVQLASRATV